MPKKFPGSHGDGVTAALPMQWHSNPKAYNARVLGSIANGSDTAESDLDILIDPTSETTLFDIGAIRHELRTLLGVRVDVLTPKALPDKFRDAVLLQAVPV